MLIGAGPFAKSTDSLDLVETRQHAVNCHRYSRQRGSGPRPSSLAIHGEIDLIAAGAQAIQHLARRLSIVLDHERAARIPLPKVPSGSSLHHLLFPTGKLTLVLEINS